MSTSGNTSGGSYTPKNGDVVADASGDLFLVSMDRASDTIALIPVAPTRSDPNVYEYASWRSREMQLGLRDLTGTSVERSDKVETQLDQSAIDGIVSVSTSGNTEGEATEDSGGSVPGEMGAPDSIAGLTISYFEDGQKETASFSSDGKVYGDKEGEWTYYTYEKVSSDIAKVTYTFENETNPEPEVETLTFSSSKGGTYSWVEYTDSTKRVEKDSSTGEFTISEGEAIEDSGGSVPGEMGAPDSIAGLTISYFEDGQKETASFSSDGKVYGDKEGEWTYYTYEKVSSDIAKVTYTFENETNPEPEVETLTFSSSKGGTYSWVEYTDSTKRVEKDSSTGEFTISEGEAIEDSGGSVPGEEKAGEGSVPGEDGSMPHLDFEGLPVSEVEAFVKDFTSKKADLQDVQPMWAEKRFDAIKKKDRFVYEIGMNNGTSLFFDSTKTYLHAAPSDEFAPIDAEFIPPSDIANEIKTAISDEVKNAEIIDAEKEFSTLKSSDGDHIFSVFFDADGQAYVAHFTSNYKLILISHDSGGDFADEWKPVVIPEQLKQYIKNNYGDLVDDVEFLPVEERPTPDGKSKEIVVFLGDGSDVIFDTNGTFIKEVNPWKDFEQNLSAGLKFDEKSSSGLGNAYINISKFTGDDLDHGSMLYRISVTNKDIPADSQVTVNDLDISALIADGTALNLTFTYDVGPPRYFIVSGANISAFKHRMPEWDRPGSFSFKASPVSPVNSASNDGGIASTFGITVEMGGERFYEGTIFETNVVNLDVGSSSMSSPWDPAASFRLNGLNGQETNVRAFIPRRLLSGNYGIMDPEDVRAALLDSNGSLSYINGSVRDAEGGLSLVGNSFQRTPYKGFEQSPQDYNAGAPMTEDGKEFLLDDSEFGISETANQVPPSNTSPETDNNADDDIASSKFDFNGDGFANSFLEVSFKANTFPAEVQIGDPFVDPFANLDNSQFGTVSGTVTAQGNSLEEYDVWFFKVPEVGKDLYSGEPVFFDFERGDNGAYTAKLPAGSYHAEAFAYDPETDTPYKPKIAGGRENPTVFLIEGNNTKIESINFSLEAEYRMVEEFAEVEATVSLAGGGKVEHVFFEMFPVENGTRLTDFPVYSFGLDRGGDVKGKIPVGTFEVEVFSPDNSVFAATFTVTINAGMNTLNEIVLSKRELVSVKGKVTDGTTGIWAEIVFVDPNNTDERFWPMWDETAMDLDEGEFSVKIPAGSYKVLAERFDGLFKSSYYNGDKADANGVVSITSAVDNLDFVLQTRPTATVTFKLLDKNDSSPVKYAWFDFFDAEDEFAPIVFPHLGQIDFESNTFDGTYTLSVPGGNYKVAIGAHNYEEVFRVLDEAGQVAWQGSSWDDASKITLTDGNTTNLGSIQISSFGKSDAELFGFDWLDEGEVLSGGSTITGSVKTSAGIAVPKARIIAHTEDYLFWFDHAQTRSDGSFELKNLPDGDWVVFAEPPFDSESFQGFRESNQTLVSGLTDGSTKDLKIVLQGSNVFGRILFPKKNHSSGETKNQGLGHAFVWAYKDEDEDGEPDWDPSLGFEQELTEVFGETDKNGYFSFYLKEAGKYSLQIDLPGQLSALSPEPIRFSLKNTNESVKLGNAIKVDWKSETRATSFDIERKASTGSSYISLFTGDMNSSKPGANAKSFVDATAKPGDTYSYRVIAETSSGQVTIDSANVRVSDPIIYLAPPSKTISGRVVDGSSSPIAGAEIVAWREEGEGWSSTFTQDDGSYELVAGSGKWEITVYRPYDTKVDWVYDAAPQRVSFAKDSKKESKSKNFTVSRMAGGKIVGSIKTPTGVSATDLSSYVFIDAFDPEGRGNWSQPDSEGKFEIPLQPGEYELTVWVDPQLKGFGSPEPRLVRVGKNSVQIPELTLTSRNLSLTGKITTSSDDPLPNVEVWAWSEQGGWVSDNTNIKGEYTLAVSPGRWEVGYDLPVVEDGSEPPYLPSPPKRIRIKDGVTIEPLNFKVRSAGAKVSGTVYGSNGAPVSNLDAWVYAREYSSGGDNEFTEILADVPLSSKGTFSFPSVAGQYLVGLWLPPGSSYSYPSEKVYTVELNGKVTTLKDENDQVVSQASFTLSENNASISGAFKLKSQAVTGLSGEVYAIRVDGDGWQSAVIEDNGTYALTLAEGNWALDYFIESDSLSRNFPSYPSKPIVLTATNSTAVSYDFDLVTASASISGTVRYDANNSAITDSSLFVWAYREGTESTPEYWNEVKSDENGTFSISVLPGGDYEVGAILSEDLRDQNYLDSLVLSANLSAGNISDLNLTISKPSSSNFITGKVLGVSGSGVEGAIVYAWADDGRENETLTDANGDFNVSVSSGAVWHVGAEFSEIDGNGSESYLTSKFETDVDLNTLSSKSDVQLSLVAPTFEVPDGVSVTFDPTKDFVTKLPDGSELTIPGGAANVATDVTEVRLVITPTAKGLSKSADEKPADYGYAMELFDNKGKKVEGNFKKDVILSIPVDVNASLAKGMDVNNIEAMYYSSTKDSWDKVKTSTWDKNSSTLIMTVDHFTTFAAVAPVDTADISKGGTKMDGGAIGDWYESDWFGNYHDASSGWIYHSQLGWLFTKSADSAGNFWLYDGTLGWLWTGPSYFQVNSSTKSHLYSSTKGNWLFFDYSSGSKKFWDYSLTTPDWITP